ncbi:diadenosine tetraphosphate (Ap4A) HIT family hydrolase [Hydrogenispora ethanolica]|uniref:Diadenosine tetraphosphate (Ap4A) HIT family hydrolase n=1 Tax=Hydrogenispora ethanolica TaxID=1082276 RepID=A0A4R1QPR9_HYDET|nr:HIT family protein [Hydrogenispora ethanolica]TCL55738.1 diadenosine tetraphosphate (Ap4A) HIT family hydrolase [Hydrogenispora ethanolica]
MDGNNCSVCEWISKRYEENKYFIGELETGYIFLSNRWQYFKGYTFFISKICASELHLLPIEFRNKFLFEMTVVSEAVQNAFQAKKINCESLGNSCSHVHWHIIPRYGTDPSPTKTIWDIESEIIDSISLSNVELVQTHNALIVELKKLIEKYQIEANLNEVISF